MIRVLWLHTIAALAGSPSICTQVSAALIQDAASVAEPALLYDVAPFLEPSGVDRLFRRAQDDPGFYVPVGYTRSAGALPRLLKLETSIPNRQRGPYALARLALGDASWTATVSHSLYGAKDVERRRTAQALHRMEQMRPRMLLKDALSDADGWVRLYAAESWIRLRSRRASRALRGLLAHESQVIRDRAAEALLNAGYRLSTEETKTINPALRLTAQVRGFRGRHSVPAIERTIFQPDPDLRAVGWAMLAQAKPPTAVMDRIRRRALRRYPQGTAGASGIGFALAGSEKSGSEQLSANDVQAGASVLWAWSQLPQGDKPIEEVAVKAQLKRWQASGHLGSRLAWVMLASQRVSVGLALSLAREELSRASGSVARASVEILREHGSATDVPVLLALGKAKKARLRVRAHLAAQQICARAE